MQSDADTVDAYLASLPADRAAQIGELLAEIRPHLPEGLSEEMGYGMICWVVPFDVLPETYNSKPLTYAALASQKNYISLYLMTVYGGGAIGETEFRQRWNGGKKLNMGKSCLRFTKLDDLDLPLIKETLDKVSMQQYVTHYQESIAARAKK